MSIYYIKGLLKGNSAIVKPTIVIYCWTFPLASSASSLTIRSVVYIILLEKFKYCVTKTQKCATLTDNCRENPWIKVFSTSNYSMIVVLNVLLVFQGNPVGQCGLGTLHLYGKGVDKVSIDSVTFIKSPW